MFKSDSTACKACLKLFNYISILILQEKIYMQIHHMHLANKNAAKQKCSSIFTLPLASLYTKHVLSRMAHSNVMTACQR